MRDKTVLRRLVTWSGVVLLALTVASCATWPDTYLTHGVDHATQDAVAKQLGPPHLSRELTTGESVWSYGFMNNMGCTTYILTFDQQRILRTWQWQSTCLQYLRP
jgi:hypothetical protein